AAPKPTHGSMRDVLSSPGAFSGVVDAGAADELPVSTPTTPSAAPTPAVTNETVEIVASDRAELMSSYSAGPHTLPEQPAELFTPLVFDIDMMPVTAPAMTPAPARPKPPNMSAFEKPDLPPPSAGCSAPAFVSPAATGVAAVPAGSSIASSLRSFSARST